MLHAQDLAPRAYVITPLHVNAITLTYSFYDGSIDYNGIVPLSGATGTYSVPIFSYYHAFSFFGRSANILASLPYGVGNFQGTVAGAGAHIYRSGLPDSTFRLSIILKGGPALLPQEFVKWKQKLLLGASLKVTAPTGQYDPTKLINWGTNRWGFKPEFGYSQRWGNWVADGYSECGSSPPIKISLLAKVIAQVPFNGANWLLRLRPGTGVVDVVRPPPDLRDSNLRKPRRFGHAKPKVLKLGKHLEWSRGRCNGFSDLGQGERFLFDRSLTVHL